MPEAPPTPPTFTYYEDPLGDGTLERSNAECSACGRRRGFIATCHASGAKVPSEARFCPWCIADGTAHARFGARFNSVDVGAAPDSRDEVERRTPGFLTWQDWDWPAHCNDAAVYRGQPTGEELRRNPEALRALLAELRQWEWGRDDTYVEEFIDGLGGHQVAYLFECRHCRTPLVRWDHD
jgi:uncharacterized protein CbrC (UPF0167 family)